MTRADIVCSYLGKPWRANAHGPDSYDCWHLVVAASAALYGRDLPAVTLPDAPSWAWMVNAIEQHPERAHWRLVRSDGMGLIRAADGAIVLMARRDRPAHIGLWLQPERIILHADPRLGVVTDNPVDLPARGWGKLRYYEPVVDSQRSGG